MNNSDPTSISNCVHCGKPLRNATAAFCSLCGRHTSKIDFWLEFQGKSYLLSDPPPKEQDRFAVLPGEEVVIRAQNSGPVNVKVNVETDGVQGFEHNDDPPIDVSQGRDLHVALKCNAIDGVLRGDLLLVSNNGDRNPIHWGVPVTRQTRTIPVHQWITTRQQKWVASVVDTIYFLPGAGRQKVQFWNNSDRNQKLVWRRVHGYGITPLSMPDASSPVVEVDVAAGKTETLEIVRVSQMRDDQRETTLFVEGVGEFAFETLPAKPPSQNESEFDAIIAIDFGTRNTSMRIRWIQQANDTDKLPGIIYPIGESRFPSLMICHSDGSVYKWGSEAEKALQDLPPRHDMLVVDDLKTLLREGVDQYPDENIKVSTQDLLQRYFENLIFEIDQACGGRGPRRRMKIHYVVCHPVLNEENDASLTRYKKALADVLEPHEISSAHSNLTFVPEPEAAVGEITSQFPETLRGLSEGDMVAVVDSGGGTTDITVARVEELADIPKLVPIANGTLCIKRDVRPLSDALNAFAVSRKSNDRQFGGNMLDVQMAFMLTQDGFDYVETNAKGLELRRPFTIGPSIAGQTPLSPVNVPPPIKKPTSEQERISSLLCARIIKEDVVTHKEKYLYDDTEGRNPFPNGYDPYSRVVIGEEEYIRWVVNAVQKSIITQFDQNDEKELKKVQTLFFVGGTCMDTNMRMAFSKVLGHRFKEEKEDMNAVRMSAVVEGAVRFKNRERHPSPISLWLHLNHPKFPDPILLMQQGTELRPRAPSDLTGDLPFLTLQDEEWQPELWAEISDRDSALPSSVQLGKKSTATVTASAKFLLARGFFSAMKSGKVRPIWAVSRAGVDVDVYVEPSGHQGMERLPLWRFLLTG